MAVVVPGLEWRRNSVSSAPISLHWIICHTIVGTVSGALGGRHYHIYIRANGSGVQIQDLRLRSAASVQGNPYSIAIVAEDMGPAFGSWSGSNVPAYTQAQVDTLVRVIAWICKRFGLPATAVRTSCLGAARGVAWHRLGIDGNFPSTFPLWGRRTGCQNWSLSRGKACPGDRRIHQINNVVLPRVRGILGGTTPPPSTGGLFMHLSKAEEKQIYEVARTFNDRVNMLVTARLADFFKGSNFVRLFDWYLGRTLNPRGSDPLGSHDGHGRRRVKEIINEVLDEREAAGK